MGLAMTIAAAVCSTIYADVRSGTGATYHLKTSGQETVDVDDVRGSTFRYRQIFIEAPMLHTRHHPLRESLDISFVFSLPNQSLSVGGGEIPPSADAILRDYRPVTLPNGFEEFGEPRLQIAHGWPWLAFDADVIWIHEKDAIVQSMDDLKIYASAGVLWKDVQDSTSPPDIRVFAYRPLWPGLIANTIFFAAVILTASLFFRSARDLRRYRRGRCPRCAYNRQFDYTTKCPECGISHSPSQTGATATPL
jgi:hypothetical protein